MSSEAKDLAAHAQSTIDFYALIGIPTDADSKTISSSYRRTSLKYHPDKIQNPTPADLEKFHLLKIARDVLLDEKLRAQYDAARDARMRKAKETAKMEGMRRKMKEDLEAAEKRGLKRSFSGVGVVDVGATGQNAADEKLQAEVRRLAEESQRLIREKFERLRREKEAVEMERGKKEEEEMRKAEEEEVAAAAARKNASLGGVTVPEMQRAVKVRWLKEAAGLELDKDKLIDLFSRFGKIENAFLLKEKKQRVGDSRKKKVIATGVVVFMSIVGAHAAVEDGKSCVQGKGKATEPEWTIIDSIFWAENKEPEILGATTSVPNATNHTTFTEPAKSSTPSRPSTPITPAPKPRHFTFATPASNGSTNGVHGLRKVPSFASFSGTPKASPADGRAAALGPNSPSLEEITQMRLKNAERKRLEEQIRREDEEAAAAANGENGKA